VLGIEHDHLADVDPAGRRSAAEVVAGAARGQADHVLVDGIDVVLARDPVHPESTGQGVVVPDVGLVDDPCEIVQDRPRADGESIEAMITIHMIADGADRASRWYQDTFGAVERSRIELPDGRLIHVELELSGSALMLADEFPEHNALSPATTGEISATFYLAVEDVDAVWQRALTGGVLTDAGSARKMLRVRIQVSNTSGTAGLDRT
jgi:uncharacterized glyoxalase superfamily protein PhnB